MRACAPTEKTTLFEEEEFSSCSNQLNMIFVECNEPSIMFLGVLRPIILPLLYVHCKICFGESHIRSKLEKTVVQFLKYSSPSLSLRVLRLFAFSERTRRDGKKDEDNLCSVNLDVMIVSDEYKGIVAAKQT